MLLQHMPKCELHLHLEGTVRPSIIVLLAKRHRHDLSDKLTWQTITEEAVAAWLNFENFDCFIDKYVRIQELMRTEEDIVDIVEDLAEHLQQTNVVYAECTVTPYTHVDMQQDKGLTLDRLLNGLRRGRELALAKHRVHLNWIFDCFRNLSFDSVTGAFIAEPAARTLEYALAGRACGAGVIGLGLGGSEVGAPPAPFKDIFAQAKQAGLISVPHAGENAGADHVRSSIIDLQADRIGHGRAAIDDDSVIQLLRERGVALEASFASNRCLLGVDCTAYLKLRKQGVLVTVNTDDPALFNTDIVAEYHTLAGVNGGLPVNELVDIARVAFQVSGASAELKEQLLARFDEWRRAQAFA